MKPFNVSGICRGAIDGMHDPYDASAVGCRRKKKERKDNSLIKIFFVQARVSKCASLAMPMHFALLDSTLRDFNGQ